MRVVGLGQGATIRGQPPDFNLEIAMSDIQPEDIELLTRELNLKETTPTTLDALYTSSGARLVRGVQGDAQGGDGGGRERQEGPCPGQRGSLGDCEPGVNVMAAEGLHSKLRRLFDRAYIVENPAADTVSEIIKALEAGQHIVLSFGNFESDLDYLLVCNLLTRRIRQAWEKRTNQFRAEGRTGAAPAGDRAGRSPQAAEPRDGLADHLQHDRPRAAQVLRHAAGDRPAPLADLRRGDVAAGDARLGLAGGRGRHPGGALGAGGREALRGMLARLQPKEEVLLLGWGVPMPLPVRSRRYDEKFWEELLGRSGKKTAEELMKDMGF